MCGQCVINKLRACVSDSSVCMLWVMYWCDITVTKFAKIMLRVYKWNENESDLAWDAGLCTVSARRKTEVLWNCEQLKDETVGSVPHKIIVVKLRRDDVSGETADRLTDWLTYWLSHWHLSVRSNKQTSIHICSYFLTVTMHMSELDDPSVNSWVLKIYMIEWSEWFSEENMLLVGYPLNQISGTKCMAYVMLSIMCVRC
jgi:hypothetical protein